MDINRQMNMEGPDVYYNSSFRDVLEQHLNHLRNHEANNVVEVTTREMEKFKYDLFNFLTLKGIDGHLHWITMRVNGWLSPTDFHRADSVIIPSKHAVNRIKQLYESSQSN